MIECRFELNAKPLSTFWCGATKFPAFSGHSSHANRLVSACIPKLGPIPPGIYYIFDRQSGGLLGPLRDLFSGKNDWFALYAADERIDDETLCDKVKRGEFRLHPKGATGRSEGCIVIDKEADFFRLRAMLKSAKQISIPGIQLQAYARLVVQ